MGEVISVLVADDHQLFRKGLIALLEPYPMVKIAGEAANGKEAVEGVLVTGPDVLLLDIVMPAMDGIEVARRIGNSSSKTQIVFLTDHHNEAYLRQAFEVGGGPTFTKIAPSMIC